MFSKYLSIFFIFLFSQFAIAKPRLEVSPTCALMDVPLSIEVHELDPFQHATIKAEIVDDVGEKWNSWASFEADETGIIYVNAQNPIEGAYEEADGMGLFWTMKPTLNPFASFKKKGDFEVELKLFVQGETVDIKNVQRLRQSFEMVKIEVKEDGLVGSLFLPFSQAPLPVIIVLGGSNGGLSENRARLIASNGFAVLALGYFGLEGLPDNLENIPLEYFERAFEWLSQRDDILGNRVGIYGISRGAELALLIGCLFPEKVQAIVAALPSYVVFGGLSSERVPAWQYRGEPLIPDAPVPMCDLSYGKGQNPEDPLTISTSYLQGMQEFPEDYAAAEIPVEKLQASLLLISGGDDQMWPSTLFASKIMDRLKAKQSQITRIHLDYPLAGHLIHVPYLPAETVYYHPHGKLWFSMGGFPCENDLASRDSWLKLLHFFQIQLCK
ncbi:MULTISPECIES: acyl-CoA thioester hydrolase/BAAT C-terminal domain-containing protein [Parachlamydia]|uniref:acyl-CoA thioester hydrolase/BAAT C-terminal domain-containing protein n=1 Tax=Parachlamydia TaxID=83551 RepID=UPI0001C17572|nr:acyl-CoA thioester hydrolase/BAAT C-terminal domain-containing protein [Parachlamydia acanthamoebae]EFB40713.1 hypothetical protein pah_c197o109 [Parachlamydia acanthamoebae str. Hall's coccus]